MLPPDPNQCLTQQNQQTVNVGLKLDQYIGVATYGVTKKIDVSVIVPINRVSLSELSRCQHLLCHAAKYNSCSAV